MGGSVFTTGSAVAGVANHTEVALMARSRPDLPGPDLQLLLVDVPPGRYLPNG